MTGENWHKEYEWTLSTELFVELILNKGWQTEKIVCSVYMVQSRKYSTNIFQMEREWTEKNVNLFSVIIKLMAVLVLPLLKLLHMWYRGKQT